MKTITTLFLITATVLAGCSVESKGRGEVRGTAMPGDPCNGTVDCTPGSICFSNVCVGEGPLRFSLSWTADTDFDLHVVTPNLNEIYYLNEMADMGQLDVDDCVSGGCDEPGMSHVENVFFMDGAPRGDYEYWVENFDGEISGDYTLEVARDNVVEDTTSGTLPAEKVDSEHLTFTY